MKSSSITLIIKVFKNNSHWVVREYHLSLTFWPANKITFYKIPKLGNGDFEILLLVIPKSQPKIRFSRMNRIRVRRISRFNKATANSMIRQNQNQESESSDSMNQQRIQWFSRIRTKNQNLHKNPIRLQPPSQSNSKYYFMYCI